MKTFTVIFICLLISTPAIGALCFSFDPATKAACLQRDQLRMQREQLEMQRERLRQQEQMLRQRRNNRYNPYSNPCLGAYCNGYPNL